MINNISFCANPAKAAEVVKNAEKAIEHTKFDAPILKEAMEKGKVLSEEAEKALREGYYPYCGLPEEVKTPPVEKVIETYNQFSSF